MPPDRTVTESSVEIRNVPDADADALTIEQLAEATGMSVRNLREWHGLGLIPAARKLGRVGYYDRDVVGRIESVRRLRAEGFTLPLIARMLDAGESAPQVMALAERLRAPFRGAAEGDRIAAITDGLRGLGMSEAQIDASAAELAEHADRIAELFERMWMEHVWQPFLDAGAPASGLAEVQATLERMQPLASESVASAFAAAMERRVARGIARELERAAEPPAAGS
jgi:DNA-binding transcriptional MerR regulator